MTEGYEVLVVDDDQGVRDLLVNYLSMMGLSSWSVGSAIEALKELENGNYSIVVSDLIMPGMDGVELIGKIVERYPEMDIIAITGYTQEYTYTDVIRAGASDFIAKPFDLDEFRAKLFRVVRERELRHELRRLTIRDPLTGTFNRRHFDYALPMEISRAVRQNYDLCLIMLDVDGFKSFNDNFGHQRGDDLLRGLAGVLEASIRKDVDTACRYGGDEFALIVPYAGKDQAVMVAERIRSNYNTLGMEFTTLSQGVASLAGREKEPEDCAKTLVSMADKALYMAKNAGGDRVIFLDPYEGD